MKTLYFAFLFVLIAGCTATSRPLPEIDPSVLNTVTRCSAGASARAGVDLTVTAKRNLERTGYEGSFGAALTQEVAGLIMKIAVGDEARVALFKEYQQCLRTVPQQ